MCVEESGRCWVLEKVLEKVLLCLCAEDISVVVSLFNRASFRVFSSFNVGVVVVVVDVVVVGVDVDKEDDMFEVV